MPAYKDLPKQAVRYKSVRSKPGIEAHSAQGIGTHTATAVTPGIPPRRRSPPWPCRIPVRRRPPRAPAPGGRGSIPRRTATAAAEHRPPTARLTPRPEPGNTKPVPAGGSNDPPVETAAAEHPQRSPPSLRPAGNSAFGAADRPGSPGPLAARRPLPGHGPAQATAAGRSEGLGTAPDQGCQRASEMWSVTCARWHYRLKVQSPPRPAMAQTRAVAAARCIRGGHGVALRQLVRTSWRPLRRVSTGVLRP